jgi:GTP-binding protein EngB required for normal cell division
MEGCPEEGRGEAVFIGRSNVGKSSLVNMVCRDEDNFIIYH